MAFITIGNTAQHLGKHAALVVLATGQGREATAAEAGECLDRLIATNDPRMGEANHDYERFYTGPMRWQPRFFAEYEGVAI